MTALMGLMSLGVFAQKGELKNADDEYQKFAGLEAANIKLAMPSLLTARTAIDKASANEKTANLPQTMALKAAIYASLAASDSTATQATESATSQEAIKKAKTLDTKNEYSKYIEHATRELAQIQLNKGVKAYQAKNFHDAYVAFDAARQLVPDDTTTVLYTGVSAYNSKDYATALTNYNHLLAIPDYRGKDKIYQDLPTLYLMNKDTAGALKIASEAVAKYPNNAELRKEEIEISLQSGHSGDVISKIEAAIKNDPNNKTLYYYEGLTYSQIAEEQDKNLKKLLKATIKAAPNKNPMLDPKVTQAEQTMSDNYGKAAEMYKKAIAVDPNYFEATLNLGFVSEAPAIYTYNAAQQIPVTMSKAYSDAMTKSATQFAVAKPYVLKAVDLNPKSVDALTNLKSYYLGTKDADNANATQKKIDALK
jgi:tetratricopeptide (TPR) repeat protein